MRPCPVALLFVLGAAAAPASAKPTVTWFDSPSAAVDSLLARKPRVIGFGEYHEIEGATAGGRKIRSAIKRFTDELLDGLAPLASDLILETWVTEGRCGKKEKEVVQKVEKDTKRP